MRRLPGHPPDGHVAQHEGDEGQEEGNQKEGQLWNQRDVPGLNERADAAHAVVAVDAKVLKKQTIITKNVREGFLFGITYFVQYGKDGGQRHRPDKNYRQPGETTSKQRLPHFRVAEDDISVGQSRMCVSRSLSQTYTYLLKAISARDSQLINTRLHLITTEAVQRARLNGHPWLK